MNFKLLFRIIFYATTMSIMCVLSAQIVFADYPGVMAIASVVGVLGSIDFGITMSKAFSDD